MTTETAIAIAYAFKCLQFSTILVKTETKFKAKSVMHTYMSTEIQAKRKDSARASDRIANISLQ